MSLTNSRTPHYSTRTDNQYWQCERKKSYDSVKRARNAVGRASNLSGKCIESYKCPFCKQWHIGKPSASTAKPSPSPPIYVQDEAPRA